MQKNSVKTYEVSLSRLSVLQKRAASKRAELIRNQSYNFNYNAFDDTNILAQKVGALENEILQNTRLCEEFADFILLAKKLRFRKNLETGISDKILEVEDLGRRLQALRSQKHSVISGTKIKYSFDEILQTKDVDVKALEDAETHTDRESIRNRTHVYSFLSPEVIYDIDHKIRMIEKEQTKLQDEIAMLNAKTTVQLELSEEFADELDL